MAVIFIMADQSQEFELTEAKEYLQSLSSYQLLAILSNEQDWYFKESVILIKYILLKRGIPIQKISNAEQEFIGKNTPKRDLFREMWDDPEYRRYIWYIVAFIVVAIIIYNTKHYDTDFVDDKSYY